LSRLLESTYQADIEVSNPVDWDDLAEIFMVNSVVTRHQSGRPALSTMEIEKLGTVRILIAEHEKCPRCWIYRMETGEEICESCNRIVNPDGILKDLN
jgi:hypothetical protein